ncbi:hypothetical protein VTN00DRAFT_451 [Thermoascus crustaceus]|uniref:uncharacterized protein n=1 Tax=Thermoascus crustaceus TaxID=5088 RepID=UPI0037422E1D
MESKSSKTWKRHEDDRPPRELADELLAAREVNRYETCRRRSCVIWHYSEPDEVNRVTEHSLETMLFHALPGQPFLALSEGPPICNTRRLEGIRLSVQNNSPIACFDLVVSITTSKAVAGTASGHGTHDEGYRAQVVGCQRWPHDRCARETAVGQLSSQTQLEAGQDEHEVDEGHWFVAISHRDGHWSRRGTTIGEKAEPLAGGRSRWRARADQMLHAVRLLAGSAGAGLRRRAVSDDETIDPWVGPGKVSLLASSVIPSHHPRSGVKLGGRDAALLHHAGPAADQEELSPCSTGASPYGSIESIYAPVARSSFTSSSEEIPDNLV